MSGHLIIQGGRLLVGCKLANMRWKHVCAWTWRFHLSSTCYWLSLACSKAIRVHAKVAAIVSVVWTRSWLPSCIFICKRWSVFFSNFDTSFFLYKAGVILSRARLVWLNKGGSFHFTTFDGVMRLSRSSCFNLGGVIARAWCFHFLISTNLRPLASSKRPTISKLLLFH